MSILLQAALRFADNNDDSSSYAALTKLSTDTIEQVAMSVLAAEVRRLQADERRLDWLADRNNTIAQVLLPSSCVTANIHSMRAAIDAAMEAGK